MAINLFNIYLYLLLYLYHCYFILLYPLSFPPNPFEYFLDHCVLVASGEGCENIKQRKMFSWLWFLKLEALRVAS